MLTNNRSDGCNSYVLRAEEKLTAFVKLESATRGYDGLS
jgi:hypothetical protein